MGNKIPRIDAFDFEPGRRLAGKYEIESLLGRGWEGEVYKVVELKTGITRAAKVFYPQRNENDRAVKYYARKLHRLRRCPIVIQYHHSETIRFRKYTMTCLISEFVEGELLSDLVARQRGQRLQPFEALHLLHALAAGVDGIHAVHFDLKLVDFYNWGTSTAAKIREDVIMIIHLFHEILGGREHYAKQPPEIKAICCGLRRDLISQKFPTAGRLRAHLESFSWSES